MFNKRNSLIFVSLILVVGIGTYVISSILVPDKNLSQRYSGKILGNKADIILTKACFNCHSNETKWPWYTSLPLINILISSDVAEGREDLNFSNWGSIPEDKRLFYLEKVFDEIEKKDMPLWIYVLGHPEAKINKDDLKILKDKATALGISFKPPA